MKLVKQNVKKIKESKLKCFNCKSLFVYAPTDVEQDRDGSYVICPSCEAFIAIK